MKIIYDPTSFLLHLLLLAELFVHSSPRPTSSPSLCSIFGSMSHQVEKLMNLSKKLPDMTEGELANFEGGHNRLDGLPHIENSAEYFMSLKMNASVSQMFVHTQAFRLHVDWLKTAKENFSLPTESAESAGSHLHRLSNLIKSSLLQISEEVPETATPTLPVAASNFDVLQFSVEISTRLQSFCNWSKRVLRPLKRLSNCPKH